MPPQMPMMPPQGMPNPAMNQGMPPGMTACPCCGQPWVMPDQSMMAPQQPLPPGQLGLGSNGQPQDSGLLAALMGGGGMPPQ